MVAFPKNLDWDSESSVTRDEKGNYEHLVPVPENYKPL